MKKVGAFGEILLRLSPPNYQTLTQSHQLDCQFGGAELNVLCTLAQLGHPVAMVSALPNHDVGRMAETFLFAHQIDAKQVLKKDGRLGLYFYQKGFSLRASTVTYDRGHSVFYHLKAGDFNIPELISSLKWLHVSGITPALNADVYNLTKAFMTEARRQNVPVSFDLNYRESLWPSFDVAREKLSELAKLATLCIGIEPLQLKDDSGIDLKDRLGLKPPYEDRAALKTVAEKMVEVYGFEYLAFTQREMTFNNEYVLKGYLYHAGELFETPLEHIQVLDRVGTGDAFTAGVVCGVLEGLPSQDVLDLAMASFKFKHTIDGDINVINRYDIDRLLEKREFEIKR